MTGDDLKAMFPGPLFPVTLLVFIGVVSVLALWKAIDIARWLIEHVSVSVA